MMEEREYVTRLIKIAKEKFGYEDEFILKLMLTNLWNVAVTLSRIKDPNFYKSFVDDPFYPEFKEVYEKIEKKEIEEAKKKLKDIYTRLREGGIKVGLTNIKKWPESL